MTTESAARELVKLLDESQFNLWESLVLDALRAAEQRGIDKAIEKMDELRLKAAKVRNDYWDGLDDGYHALCQLHDDNGRALAQGGE